MFDVHSDIKDITDKIDRIVCEHAKCTIEDIKGLSKKNKLPLYRNVLFLFLKDYIGVSYGKLSLLYNRTPRNIKRKVANARVLVKYDFEYRHFFLCVCDKYEKEGA